MCAAFSALQGLNYFKMDPKAVEEKLTKAFLHLGFALQMCEIQAEIVEMHEYQTKCEPNLWKCNSIKRNAHRNYGNAKVLSEMQAEIVEMQEYEAKCKPNLVLV